MSPPATSGETRGIISTDSIRAVRRPGLAHRHRGHEADQGALPGMTGARWEEMHATAIDFLDRFGDDALALGWTVTDLFGVHPTVGLIRVDYCGALMINARRVEAISDTWFRYGNQTYRMDRPGRSVGVPVWEGR